MLRSNVVPRQSACLTTLIVAVAVSLCATQPVRAGKPQSSPFAGHYGCTDNPYFDIAISRNGSIGGSLDYWTDISGTIWADGYLEITTETLLVSWGNTRGRRSGKYTRTAVGLGALDEDGNLYGVVEWNNGSVGEFFWPRCD